MSFFTNKSLPNTEPEGLQPLSTERIVAALNQLEVKHSIDDEGDVFAGWDLGYVYFLIRGEKNEIFFSQGYWRAELDGSDYAEALEIANEWNATRFWPRTVARRVEGGGVRMETGHVVDYEHGLTDEQLLQHILSTLAPTMNFFESLNERFPAAWQRAISED